MHRTFNRLVRIFLITVVVTGCAEQFKTYVNYAQRIKIHYPVAWIMQEEVMGAVVTFNSAQEGANDRFQENVSIIIQDLGEQKVTLKQYTEAVIGQLPRIMPGLNLIESKPIILSKNPAHKIICTAQQAEFRLKILQVWTIKDNRTYMLTFTAEEGKYPKFDKTVEKMLKTFKIM